MRQSELYTFYSHGGISKAVIVEQCDNGKDRLKIWNTLGGNMGQVLLIRIDSMQYTMDEILWRLP